ncbi:MAG: AAA family ATPase, partial [Pseudomonadota bacterium]
GEAAATVEEFGHARAIEAIDMASAMAAPGYNMFVIGPNGAAMRQIVERRLSRLAAGRARLSDWVYVNNFDGADRPIALELPAGRAGALRERMLGLIDDLKTSLPAVFESDEYRTRREALDEDVRARQQAAFDAISDDAQQRGAAIVRTPMGFVVAYMRDEKVLSPDEFQELPAAEQERAKGIVTEVQDRLQAFMRTAPTYEKERRDAVRTLDRETAKMAVEQSIDDIVEAFRDVPKVCDYLEVVRRTLIESAAIFLAGGEEESLSLSGPSRGDGRFEAFSVNVMVSQAEGDLQAPVVFEDHPTMQNLIGRIEHVSHQGALLTNFALIKAGALHKANGGFLLLDARQILTQPFAWSALKRALRARAIRMTSPAEYLGFAATVSLEPDPIPLDVKVAIFGERIHYYLLLALDPEIRDLFKIVADFEDTADRSAENERTLAGLLADIARQEGLRPLERGAAEALVEYAVRLGDDAQKVSLQIDRMTDRLREADHFCAVSGRETIAATEIAQALDAERWRIGRIRERAMEAVQRNIALVDTDGAVTGQINGLSVLQVGDLRFGGPSRITARVRVGAGKVVDIEREVELGGPTHSKGVLILSGYLASRFALDVPISLAASLVFEQSYGRIDGDSASSAELYALLSALSDLPLKQSLAVTGSVNQLGQVQAIGGVNEKIEGFFDTCAGRVLTGRQGVLIPAANVQHLMLREDVVEACRDGRFAVYPVQTIDQGIALLTGLPAGTRGANGLFPEGSVNARVEARLVDFAQRRRAFGEAGKTGSEPHSGETS